MRGSNIEGEMTIKTRSLVSVMVTCLPGVRRLLVPPLASYAFPAEILTSAGLEMALHPSRLKLVRAAIADPATTVSKPRPVVYIAPWNPKVIETGSVDLVLSQSVLEYPSDLEHLYSEMDCERMRS